MSSISYSVCSCCGRQFGYGVGSALIEHGGAPPRCSMCEHRNGWCQHNLFERVAAGGPNIAHTSKPCGEETVCEWILCSGVTTTRLRADRTSRDLLSLVDTLTTRQRS